MIENTQPFWETHLDLMEPDDRLVILARTIQVGDREAETALKDRAVNSARFGGACLGQALYRHSSDFGSAAEAPVWSHLELSYFRDIVPADVIYDLVLKPQPAGAELLRAEILLTTPSSFMLPNDWQGLVDRPEWQASLEYIDVQPAHLGKYRNAMQQYFGPAAGDLIRMKRIGTFRSMETAAVLYRDPRLKIDWNQIHLCEIDPKCFDGFGPLFSAVLPEELPDDPLSGLFASLGKMRKISCWTLNDAVVEGCSSWGRRA